MHLSSFIVESLKSSHSLGSVLRLRCFQDTRELLALAPRLSETATLGELSSRVAAAAVEITVWSLLETAPQPAHEPQTLFRPPATALSAVTPVFL